MTEQSSEPDSHVTTDKPEDGETGERIVVASSETIGIHDTKQDPTAAVQEPAKVMRLGMMIKQLLEEVRSAPLDEAARERMAEVHERSLTELESGLSPELVDELHRITLPFADDGTPPSDAELRIAQAQLVGWLEGLFHGIQAAMFAQQAAARQQFEELRRRGLPDGQPPEEAGSQPGPPDRGQYL